MRIGEFVKDHLDEIFRYCESDPAELTRLMDTGYSKKTFGLAWPFCADASGISVKDHIRYWRNLHVVCDRRVRVCSQWFERQREPFRSYLVSRGIAVPFAPETAPTSPIRAPEPRNGRYGSIHIGDAQNALIRLILSKIGEASFDERDWQATKAYFDNRCAYCPDGGADQMDHGVPINRTKLGEHRLGNVIPACKKCNSGKHQRDYREHLGEDQDRIDRIENYMTSSGYVPLGDNKQVKAILDQAHKEVAALAERYIAIINTALAVSSKEAPAGPSPSDRSGEHPCLDESGSVTVGTSAVRRTFRWISRRLV
jgi:hypothetical protein